MPVPYRSLPASASPRCRNDDLDSNDRAGLTAFGTLALYGLGRFVVEHFRTDSPAIFMNITLAQATCFILAALSIFATLFFNKSR